MLQKIKLKINWPVSSCDLTLLDYFLWSYGISFVYTENTASIAAMEASIERVIGEIPAEMCVTNIHIKLLTYLFGHYNLLQVLASANLRRNTSRAVAAWLQFRIPNVLRFSSTCLAQRWGGRPGLRRHPSRGSDSKALRTGLELSIRATWLSHRRRCILIRFTMSMSSYISYSFWYRREKGR